MSAYDTRAVVKEQVHSLGATFLEIDLGVDARRRRRLREGADARADRAQRAFMVQHIGASDVVITTAAVPGRRAPLLITEEAVNAMRPAA